MNLTQRRNTRGSITLWLLMIYLYATLLLAQSNNTHASSTGQTLPTGVTRVTSVEGITEYELSNGFKVLLFPDQSKATITVNVTYLAGSRNESYGETGMAHLLEHLLFKGTPSHRNIPQELSAHGATPNGSTSFDRTNYFETFSATDENLRWALELEADRMVNSNIARHDLESELTVVRNEYESGENNPGSILRERVFSTAYLWHNYGKATIGARSDIENVPIERVQAFYRNYYQPDNAVLLVTGRFDEPRTIALIGNIFGRLPRPERQLQKSYTSEPAQDGERVVTLRRVGGVQLLSVAYHVPSGSDPDLVAVDLIADILAGQPSGRLNKALVESKRAAYVGGFTFKLREPGLVYFFAEVPRDTSIDDARDTLLRTLESVAQNPPTEEELERARAARLKQIELTLNSSDQVGLALSEWIAMGDWRLFFLHRDRLREVTSSDIQRVAASYLKPSNRTLGVFLPTDKPDRADIRTASDVVALLKDYKGKEAPAAGEAFDPTPANIEARITRLTTADGLQLALLPKKTRGQTVTARLTFHFGDESSLRGRRLASEFAVSMLLRGTAKHTSQQLQDEFDRLKAQIVITGHDGQAAVSVETIRNNFSPSIASRG